MGKSNSKLKPEVVEELTRKTYCKYRRLNTLGPRLQLNSLFDWKWKMYLLDSKCDPLPPSVNVFKILLTALEEEEDTNL